MSEDNNKLLIIEDDKGIQTQLKWSFDDYEVMLASDRVTALEALTRYSPPVVTLDLGLPPDPDGVSEGFATLEQILAQAPDTKVIMVTGNEEHENAIRAIALGAYDFFQKPIDVDMLALVVKRAFYVYALEQENRNLARRTVNTPLEGVIAASPQMMSICRTIEKVAPTNVTILLLGESGTGKEVLAGALHALSDRGDKRFVAINCASIPENLLESELFGYEKGAFTGAAKQTIGKIEHANGGTLFLDEMGDLPLSLQAKLLRFLQERVIERLGGRDEVAVDVRVICATNQDLAKMIKESAFREDLYYRVNEITINIPPLRDREGDVVLLARAFMNDYCQEYSKRIKGFTDEAINAMEHYRWPGNVRELASKVKRAIILGDGDLVTTEDLGLDECGDEQGDVQTNLKAAKDQLEIKITRRVLSLHNGNVSKAAEAMGVSRPTLYAMIEKHKLNE